MRNAIILLGAIVLGAMGIPRLWHAFNGTGAPAPVQFAEVGGKSRAEGRVAPSPSVVSRATPSIEGMLQEQDPVRRAALQEEILAGMDVEKLPALLSEAMTLPVSRARDHWVRRLFAHWGSLQPAAALVMAQRVAPQERHLREDDVLAGWVARDPDAAWQWALEHPSPAEWTGLARGALRIEQLVVTLLEIERPQEALRLLATVAEPRITQRALDVMLTRMANFDLAHAVEVVGELPPSRLKTDATIGVLGWLGQEDPVRAGAIAAGFDDSAARERAFATALTPGWTILAEKDPETPRTVLKWVMDLPAGPVRDSALAATVPRLIGRDAAELDDALGSFADPAIRQRVLAAAVTGLSAARGREGMDVIIRHAPAPDRLQLMKMVVARWAVRSAADAQSYVATHPGLLDSERSELLGLLPAN